MDIRRATTFLMVGGCGYVLNTAIVYLLHGRAGLGITAASAVATQVAIAANFLGHTRWTFAGSGAHGAAGGHAARFWRFQLASLLSACVTVVTLTAIHDAPIPLAVANLLAVGAGSGLNFAISSTLIWRPAVAHDVRTAA